MGQIVLDIEGDGGTVHFQALAPNDALTVTPGAGPDSPPQIELVGAWVYLVGSKPKAASDIAVGGSETTKLIVHMVEASAGNHGRVRFILLEGQGAWVSRLDGTGTHQMTKAMTYIDAWRDSSGGLDRIDDPEEFDGDSTPGSEGIIEEVEAARNQHGLP